MSTSVDDVVGRIGEGAVEPVYLVIGERILAEPAAVRIARALAGEGGTPEVRRRPPRLGPLLADLQTYSLFGGGKSVVAVETSLFSDLGAAALLIDEAAEALPLGDGEPGDRELAGARRLVRALTRFGVDPTAADPARAVGELPDWVLGGAGAARRERRGRRRNKRQRERLREELVGLLELALEAGVVGWAESELAELAEIADGGLPEGHALVLAERAVADEHPLVATLEARGAVVRLGTVESQRRGGWQGLGEIAAQLAAETGVEIDRPALDELARRTLRQSGEKGARGRVDADSTERLAGEYRKLASLAGGGRIDRALVERSVEDRGEEDVWKILDAIGDGKGAEALARIRRLLAAADDPVGQRLALFGLLAGFCRNLTAVRGMMQETGVPAGERSYNRFKQRHAPALQKELRDGLENPLSGLHPFRLHRAYLAAGRLPAELTRELPWRVLETELRLKGESGAGEAALTELVGRLAGEGAKRAR